VSVRVAIPLLLLLLAAGCRDDPGGGELTGTSSPEAEGRRATETPPPGSDTALTGTFGGNAPGSAPGQPAATATHPGATGTDAATATDPNVSTTAPPARTST
jgi:hypothetical protein